MTRYNNEVAVIDRNRVQQRACCLLQQHRALMIWPKTRTCTDCLSYVSREDDIEKMPESHRASSSKSHRATIGVGLERMSLRCRPIEAGPAYGSGSLHYTVLQCLRLEN